MSHLELVALVVRDYQPAIDFFVDVLQFDLVEDVPSLTNDGRPKRWVVVRPKGAATLLLARADGETRRRSSATVRRPGRFFLRVDDFESPSPDAAAGVGSSPPPRGEPYGQVAVFLDLEGNRWDLLGSGLIARGGPYTRGMMSAFAVLRASASALIAVVAVVSSSPPATPPSPADAFTVQDVMVPARRREALHEDLHAEEPAGRCRSSSGARPTASRARPALRALLQGAGRRRLHLRVPGHPRQVRVRRHLRDATAGPRARRHDEPRRRHRHLRHHRVAAEERAQQQRPRRHARRVLRRLDHDHGRDRTAPGPQGDLAAGLARRHVARRRLPPQRRLPPELRLRIRHDDGEQART